MNNNKIGCLGWIVVLLFLAPIIELIINFWYVLVAGVIIYLVWDYWDKRKAREAMDQQTTTISPPDPPKPKEIVKPSYLPQVINYQDVLDYVDLEPPIMKIEGNKYINSWTGNITASPKSMDETIYRIKQFGHQKKTFEVLFDKSKFNHAEALHEYYEVISTPFYEGGLLAYQRGDFDKAEIWWIKVFDVLPFRISERLRAMYRKQHRYKDVVDMYRRALKIGKDKLSAAQEDRMVKEKNKAGEVLLNHLNDDQSRGIATLSSLADNRFVEELKGLSRPDTDDVKS